MERVEVKNIQVGNDNLFDSLFKLTCKDELNKNQFLTISCHLIVVNVLFIYICLKYNNVLSF